MMNKSRKLMVILAAILVVNGVALTACSTTKTTTEETGSSTTQNNTEKQKTLVEATAKLNGVFNPFFATTSYDRNISDKVHASLISNDREGIPTDHLAKYTQPVEVKKEDGTVEKTVYTFELVEGAKFSDGQPVTADDVIFSLKVYCDPTYSGSSTIFTTPIIGVNEYRYDDVNYAAAIEKIKVESEKLNDEEITTFIKSQVDKKMETISIEDAMEYVGYENKDTLTGDKLKESVLQAYYTFEIAKKEDYKAGATKAKYKELETAYIQKNLESSEGNVTEIEGIKKIDDRTVEITIDGVDPKAIWNLGGFMIAPAHYYGKGLEGGANAGKEFKKGDLTVVEEKNAAPMGAGPYIFDKFENNVVSYLANEMYFQGAPKTKKYKVQVADAKTHMESVQLGQIDIGEPNASVELVQQAKEQGIHYELVDNLGYGYIGINSERVTDLNVRKGLMTLMNRKPAVEAFYGTELASIIERPMSKVSWAYPEDAKPTYTFDPSVALDYFKAAGYTQTEKNGKKILEKNGKQLKIEVGIGGEGSMAHPAAPVLTQMKDELDKLGGVLEINDVDSTILFDKLNSGGWDMWVAAWSSTIDPDMYQVYNSKGPSNHYRIKNAELDELTLKARQTTDIKVRKEMYTRVLDIIMDQAIEMPVYQRKNMYVFNPEIVNTDSLTKDMSPFYTFRKEYHALEVK
ncbi:MAG: ABC transporter substrate-binding protein [Oscillospiraceae bacterium]